VERAVQASGSSDTLIVGWWRRTADGHFVDLRCGSATNWRPRPIWAPMTDEELLEASGRDRTAFGEFYERTERGVLGFLVAATRSADLAADLTAETFVAALSSVGRVDPQRGGSAGVAVRDRATRVGPERAA
jgi:hypothetical protein